MQSREGQFASSVTRP
nr:unnamed protein product [Callosobruchus chinensis]CAH7738186.1 unnamed protein product [Callosobruchus chinensis]CAH7746826.1 unnamed protein product [Callosobruchus chinensis]